MIKLVFRTIYLSVMVFMLASCVSDEPTMTNEIKDGLVVLKIGIEGITENAPSSSTKGETDGIQTFMKDMGNGMVLETTVMPDVADAETRGQISTAMHAKSKILAIVYKLKDGDPEGVLYKYQRFTADKPVIHLPPGAAFRIVFTSYNDSIKQPPLNIKDDVEEPFNELGTLFKAGAELINHKEKIDHETGEVNNFLWTRIETGIISVETVLPNVTFNPAFSKLTWELVSDKGAITPGAVDVGPLYATATVRQPTLYNQDMTPVGMTNIWTGSGNDEHTFTAFTKIENDSAHYVTNRLIFLAQEETELGLSCTVSVAGVNLLVQPKLPALERGVSYKVITKVTGPTKKYYTILANSEHFRIVGGERMLQTDIENEQFYIDVERDFSASRFLVKDWGSKNLITGKLTKLHPTYAYNKRTMLITPSYKTYNGTTIQVMEQIEYSTSFLFDPNTSQMSRLNARTQNVVKQNVAQHPIGQQTLYKYSFDPEYKARIHTDDRNGWSFQGYGVYDPLTQQITPLADPKFKERTVTYNMKEVDGKIISPIMKDPYQYRVTFRAHEMGRSASGTSYGGTEGNLTYGGKADDTAWIETGLRDPSWTFEGYGIFDSITTQITPLSKFTNSRMDFTLGELNGKIITPILTPPSRIKYVVVVKDTPFGTIGTWSGAAHYDGGVTLRSSEDAYYEVTTNTKNDRYDDYYFYGYGTYDPITQQITPLTDPKYKNKKVGFSAQELNGKILMPMVAHGEKK